MVGKTVSRNPAPWDRSQDSDIIFLNSDPSSRRPAAALLPPCWPRLDVGARANIAPKNADIDQPEPIDLRMRPAGLKIWHMLRIAPVVVVFLIGCGTMQLAEIPIEGPELVRLTPLPPMSSLGPTGGLRLIVMLHVLKDGTVEEARIIGSSGVAEWDSLALQSIRQWQFTPARRNGEPIDIWIRQPIAIKPQEQTILTLAELALPTKREADSLYLLLENGADFDTLVSHSSIAYSRQYGGHLGAVDISVYPEHVRRELQKLSQGEFTPPLRVGERYLIYKRYKL